MSSIGRKLVSDILALFQVHLISRKLAATLILRIFETDVDASSGVSPDNSKNDGTGCTLVFA